MREIRGKKVERKCACGCGAKVIARLADVKRGWGKYYSKSCKAKAQYRKIGYPYKEERLHPFDGDNFEIEPGAVG